MALNWTMLNTDHSPVPLPHEQTIITIDSGAELSLLIPDASPSSSASGGGSEGFMRLKEVGRIWLTDQRLIFVTPPSGFASSFESLSVPLQSILSTAFEQPLFGANYLSFDIKPSPEGGLTTGTKGEIRFKDRGMFEFVALLEKTRERALYMKRQTGADDDEGLPLYTSSASSSVNLSSSNPSATPIDNPPGYDA